MCALQKNLSDEIASLRDYLINTALIKYSKDEDSAQDLAHDTIERAISKIHLYNLKSNTKIITWLVTIMHHIQIDQYRKRGRRIKGAYIVKDDWDIQNCEHLLPIIEEQSDSALLMEDILKSMSVLTETERKIMKLSMDGYSNPEIVEETKIANGAVRSHLFRARLKIMQEIDYEIVKIRKNGRKIKK